MNIKEEARDLHYKLIEDYHLSNSPADNAEIRALIVGVITGRFNAALDSAVRVASEMAGEYKDLGAAHGGAEIAKAIKELKNEG